MHDRDESHHQLIVGTVLEVQDLVRLYELRSPDGGVQPRHAVGHEDTDQLRTSPMVTGMTSLTSIVKRKT